MIAITTRSSIKVNPDERRLVGRHLGARSTEGVAMDVTEQKKAQLAIEAYQSELRSLSSSLTLAEERARRQAFMDQGQASVEAAHA